MSAPMLTSAEQRSAARQLTLAMLALGLARTGSGVALAGAGPDVASVSYYWAWHRCWWPCR